MIELRFYPLNKNVGVFGDLGMMHPFKAGVIFKGSILLFPRALKDEDFVRVLAALPVLFSSFKDVPFSDIHLLFSYLTGFEENQIYAINKLFRIKIPCR